MSNKIDNVSELLSEQNNNFDAKNILNRSQGVVSQEIINSIESGGITSEMLQSFPFPIFKYRTQITLHGKFISDRDYFITGGYKNLIINKNKSLGVRYSAIDMQKKQFIYKVLRLEKSRFFMDITSTSSSITSYLKHTPENLETMKQVFTMLPTNYIGFSQLYISQSMFGTYIVIKLYLNAIYQNELFSFLSQLLQKDYSQEIFDANLKAKELSDKQYYEAQEIKYAQEREEKQKVFEAAKSGFLGSHSVKYIHTFNEGRFLFFENGYNGLDVKCLNIFRNRNKMLMYYISDVRDLTDIPTIDQTDRNRKQLKDFKLKRINERLQKDYYFKLVS